MTIKIPSELDKKILYYISGPMTGYENFNYPAFQSAKEELANAGVLVASPHDNPWPDEELVKLNSGNPDFLWKFMMKSALRLLLDCDGIILLPGWPKSRGAVAETNIAASMCMPMYYLAENYLISMNR